MRRRDFLTAGTAGLGLLTGCGSTSETTKSPETSPPATTDTETRTPGTRDETESGSSADKTEPARTLVVSPTGADSNPGTSKAPLRSIQAALEQAGPGTTISLEPGVHTAGDPERPVGITRRGGTPAAPIRIVGPQEAIVRGPPTERSSKPLFHICHSNVVLAGMTLDGLTKPTAAGAASWYRPQLVNCSPPTWQDAYPDYLTNITIAPRAIGNARKKLISSYRTNTLDIGAFEVVGPAGVDWSIGEETGYPLGAVISLGRSSNNFGTAHYPWDGPDESHDIRIHHVAHLAGHHHTELVKLHAGNYDVTIEYCTDTGGMTRSGVQFPAARSTVRWCVFTGSPENGVTVYTPPMKERGSYEAFSTIPDARFPGRNNDIYHNTLENNAAGAIGFASPAWIDTGPDTQGILCDNTTDGKRDRACPDSVPDTDEIGHTGGESPWTP